MKVLIKRPKFPVFAPRAGAFDPYALYLASYLRANGISVYYDDEYFDYNKKPYSYFAPSVLSKDDLCIIMLGHDFIRGHLLDNYLRHQDLLFKSTNIYFSGYIAQAFKSEIINNYGFNVIPPTDTIQNTSIKTLLNRFFSGDAFANDRLTIDPSVLPVSIPATIPIMTSVGCRNQCSFCGYNWIGKGKKQFRRMEDVESDIDIVIKNRRIHKISFADTNYGSDHNDNKYAIEIAQYLLSKKAGISYIVDIQLDRYSEGDLAMMVQSGLTTVVTGLETFNNIVRTKIYNKHIDTDLFIYNMKYLQRCGVNVIVSMILFNPFTSLEDLTYDINTINKFKFYNMAQLIVNSVLRVLPGTEIANSIKRAGLLKIGRLNYGYRFKDQTVADIISELKQWHRMWDNATGSIASVLNRGNNQVAMWIMKRKIDELAWVLNRIKEVN